jgi:imidazolonepropionase
VFAGDRAAEFEARMAGRPYDGGGIASTVTATRAAGDDQLRTRLRTLVAEARSQGSTTVEVKSGYGLTVDDEVRALRLAREVTSETTFLGAHVVPPGTGREAYVDLVVGPMLAACAPYARWADVFCEPASPHAFDGEQAGRSWRRPAGPGSACACTPTSSPPAGGAARRGARRGERRPLHVPHARRRRRARRLAHRRDAPAGCRVLDAVALPGRPPAARRRVVVALATDCNPGSASPRPCRSASPWRSGSCT